jgi:segregation and condensation protein B
MSTDNNSSDREYDSDKLRQIVEGALLAAGRPLSVQQLRELFDEDTQPARDLVEAVLGDIQADCKGRGYELKEVANGWRFQVRQELSPWVLRLWEEKPQKYSRALLETLALVAYRQPITRGEIEDIRGVAVSSQIMKTLQERNWVRVVGHRDVPGRPAMYATTRDFLDYFNLKNLEDLPSLAEIRDLNSIGNELDLVQDNAVAQAFADHNGAADGDAASADVDDTAADGDDGSIGAAAQAIAEDDDAYEAAAGDDAVIAISDDDATDDERVLH